MSAVVVLTSKFSDGGWLIVACLPLLVSLLSNLGRHQHKLRAAAATDASRHSARVSRP